MDSKKLKIRKGYALILAILVMAITTLVSVALAGIVIGGLRMSKQIDDSIVAFYAAESGIEEASWRVISQGERDPANFLVSALDPKVFGNGASWIRSAESLMGSELVIRSTGRFRDARMALQVRIPLPP